MPYDITTFDLPGGDRCLRVVGSGYITRADADYLLDQVGLGKPLHGLPMLLLAQKMEGLSAEARSLFADTGEHFPNWIAIVVTNPIIRVTSNFILRISRKKYKVVMFSNEAEALQWLDERVREDTAKPGA